MGDEGVQGMERWFTERGVEALLQQGEGVAGTLRK